MLVHQSKEQKYHRNSQSSALHRDTTPSFISTCTSRLKPGDVLLPSRSLVPAPWFPLAGPKHSTDRERGEVSENLGRQFLYLCFLTKLQKTSFLMSFPCRTLKIIVSHVTLDTKEKPHQDTTSKALKFNILFWVSLSQGKNMKMEGLQIILKINITDSPALVSAYIFWNAGIEDWFARRTPCQSLLCGCLGKDRDAIFEMLPQQVLRISYSWLK